ncbi:arginine--tRNA ligase, partial [Bifidobacterium animalis subsp. lactis]
PGEQLTRFAKALVAAAHDEPTPGDGYKGAYIDESARRVIVEANAEGIDILKLPRVDGGTDEKGEPRGEGDSEQREEFRKRAVQMMFDEIRQSMKEFRVHFDLWV